ncbi:MAG: penicillin-binding transpeptidase domain-containing protein [Gammaproteobacteria bacterium]|nr:penicillin-binding transpeptidase domain-containing protein [Gammaproteobacteria bacterium]
MGSLLKPVIALTALESGGGYHLASPVADVPFSMTLKTGATWAPSNYDNEFHGVVPMLVAISESYNVASARLGVDVGVDPFVRRPAGLGLDSPPPAYPSALLGAVEMSPLEVARLYLPFASGGLGFPPRAYVTATDGKRRVLSRNPSSTSRPVDADMHFLVHFALRTVVDRGTASRVLGDFGKALRLAGKTGTTDDFRDSWFAGYSGNYIAVVWVGRDDNEPTGLSGSSGALPIWRDLMRELPLRPSVFDRPANVQWHNVDLVSGYRVDSGCATAMEVPFIEDGSAAAPRPLRQHPRRRHHRPGPQCPDPPARPPVLPGSVNRTRPAFPPTRLEPERPPLKPAAKQNETTVGACLQAIDAAGTTPEESPPSPGPTVPPPGLRHETKPL